MKTMKSEIKENVQGTNSDEKETGIQINGLDQKEEINILSEQNEETRIQKTEEKLRNLQDNSKCTTSESYGCQKEKRKSKKLKTYLKKIMKNISNLAKEIDFQEDRPGSSESPREIGPKEAHTKAHHNYISQD